MNEEDTITVGYGDEITLEQDPFDRESGDVVVRIINGAFVEPARWLRFDMAPGHDREAKINELIIALERVRDSQRS